MSSAPLTTSSPTQPAATTKTIAPELQQQPQNNPPAVKPCCVCKDEKAARDECMLLSTGADPAQECGSMVERYRTCMRGYGFSVG